MGLLDRVFGGGTRAKAEAVIAQQRGAIMDFVKQYNAATESQVGTIIPVEITVFEDRYRALVHHLLRVEDPTERVFGSVGIREGYEVHPSELKKPAAQAAVAAVAVGSAGSAQTTPAVATPKNYSSMKKPDLIKAIAGRTGKAPHGTTPVASLRKSPKQLLLYRTHFPSYDRALVFT